MYKNVWLIYASVATALTIYIYIIRFKNISCYFNTVLCVYFSLVSACFFLFLLFLLMLKRFLQVMLRIIRELNIFFFNETFALKFFHVGYMCTKFFFGENQFLLLLLFWAKFKYYLVLCDCLHFDYIF